MTEPSTFFTHPSRYDAPATEDITARNIARIVAGPEHPDRDFACSRCTYRELYRLAESIRLQAAKGFADICVCSEDKGLVAASLLAALTEGFSVILPFACSVAAVEEISGSIDISAVLADRGRDRATNRATGFPKGMPVLSPRPLEGDPPERTLAVDPDVPFLKFFTGGSTGKPKMWSKTPRNLFAEAFFHARKYGITPADRILSTVPPYHIYGFLYSVLIPLVSSASVIETIPTYPEEIRRTLLRRTPTLFVSVPVHYRVLNGTDIPGDSLRHAVSSAGKLDAADADYFTRETGVELVEIYGSTETGGIADRRRAAGETALTPFEAVDWKIVDERLCVRSEFISPDIETDRDEFFTTGDRVEPAGKNRLRLLGRVDGIVKVGGKRVDLESIRDTLKRMPDVEDAVVLSLPGAAGRENDILAAVQGPVTAEMVQEAILKRLESHAAPRRIKVVERIPVSSSGKYDRTAIEALFQKE